MKTSHYIKVCFIVFLIASSVAVLWSHHFANLWPGVHLFTLSAVILSVILLRTDLDFHVLALSFPVGIGIFIRLHTYVFPASMIGGDPDSFANDIQGVIATGSVDVISSAFYRDAPLFHILAAEVGIVSGIPAMSAVGIYPVLSGILYPVLTFLLIRYLLGQNALGEWGGFVGAIVAAVGTVSVRYAFWPIAQTLSAILWLVLLYLVVRYFSTRTVRGMVLMAILAVGVLYSHKLPLSFAMIVFALTVMFLLLYKYSGYISKNLRVIHMNYFESHVSASIRNATFLALFFFLLLMIQYFYTTRLGGSVINRFLGIFGPQTEAALYSGPYEAVKAIPVGRDLHQVVFRRLYGVVLIPIAGLSWVILVWQLLRGRPMRTPELLILSGAVVASLFMINALIAPVVGGGVNRYILLAEPIFIVLVILAVPRRWNLLKIVVILIVVAQLFSGAVIAPDHPRGANGHFSSEGAEQYLSIQDISAKNHGLLYVSDTVYTDSQFAGERTPTQINVYQDGGQRTTFSSFDHEAFLDGRIIEKEYEHVLIRDRTTFRLGGFGWYQIIWVPENEYDNAYNRIYDNDDTFLYSMRHV